MTSIQHYEFIELRRNWCINWTSFAMLDTGSYEQLTCPYILTFYRLKFPGDVNRMDPVKVYLSDTL